jgi:adenosine deaminase
LQTDDILPFKTSLVGEYAMLLALAPYGLGLTEEQVQRIAEMGMNARFR